MADSMGYQTEPNNPQFQPKKSNVIYDEQFVKYINALCDSIKEFCKVTKNNINESFRCLNSSKYITEQLTVSLNQMMNTNNQEKINDLFQKIDILNQNTQGFEENLNSNSESITLFFNDAKFLVKQMKELRKKNLTEMNSELKNRPASPYITNKININNNNNSCLNVFNGNDTKQLNMICNDILATLKNFSNNLVYSFDIKKRYDEMTNSIKIKLDKITSMSNNNSRIYSNGANSQLNQPTNYNRSKSPLPINKLKYGFEKANQMNKSYETQIYELQEQIKAYKYKIQLMENKLKFSRGNSEININNNNKVNDGSSKIGKDNKKNDKYSNSSSTQIHLNKNNVNNSPNNLNNQLLMKKDNEIMLYKNKLNFCQKRINMLITELNKVKRENFEKTNSMNKFQNMTNSKSERYSSDKEHEIKQSNIQQMRQYEETINELNEEILKYKNIINMNNNKFNPNNNDSTIFKLQKELQFKNNQILKLNNQVKMIGNDRNRLNMQLQSYISGSPNNNNFQYENEIQELNNQIINLNKIIEEKDNIINQQSNLKLQNYGENEISQLIQENNNLKQELLKYTDNKNLGTDFDILMKENEEYKKQFEELQDKFIKTKIFYEENLTNLQNNFQNKDLLNELMEYKNTLFNTELERDKLTKELNELKNNNNNNEYKILNNTNDNNELIKKINELSSNLKTTQDSKNKLETEIKKKNEEIEGLKIFIKKLESEREKIDDNKHRSNMNISGFSQNDKGDGIPMEKYTKVINRLNDAEQQIVMLQKSNKDLQNKLEEKEAQKIVTAYRTEDFNFSNYEEEFDLKKMVNGARDKNRSEDINIDYPGVQGIKEKQRELLQKMNMLEEQVKILLCNINCSGKIKPTVTQICQLLGLNQQRIQMVIAGKDKKSALGIVS